MRLRECMSKNAGVAGYVKAFWHVLSESQTGQCINYLLFAVLEHKADMKDENIKTFCEHELMFYTNCFNNPEQFEEERKTILFYWT